MVDDRERAGVQPESTLKGGSKLRRAVRRFTLTAEERELLSAAERSLLPGESGTGGAWVGCTGYSLNEEQQLDVLDEFRSGDYQAVFEALRGDPRVNAGLDGVDYGSRELIHNGYFPSPDAELYAAMILRSEPTRIVEIGAGFSTRVARAAIDHGSLACELHAIDPEARTSVSDVADRVEAVPVQESSLAESRLQEGSLLFIDSSHVTRPGGDGPFIYCRLLPSLPPDVLVHIHDVFLPYDYPSVYHRRFYTEQYLLHALLANSRKFEVIFSTYLMSVRHRQAMQATFGPRVGDSLFCGASFWIRSLA